MFLDDEHELWLAKVFVNSREFEPQSGIMLLNPIVVFEYCDEYSENRIATLETLNHIKGLVNAKLSKDT